jgi:hypothetical protein
MKIARVTDEELIELQEDIVFNPDRYTGRIGRLLQKTIYGYQVLVDHAADKSKDYLEYRSDIKEFLDSNKNVFNS